MKRLNTALLVIVLICFAILNTTAEEATAGSCDAADGVCLQEKTDAVTPQRSPSKVKVAKGSNSQGAPPEVKKGTCKDRYEVCKEYQQHGECEKNPGWMIVNCPHSCQACHLLDPKLRCNRQFLNISADPAFAPGEMEAMFVNLQQDFPQFEIEYLSTDPYVILFNNFVTDEETTAILESVQDNWERSTDTGKMNEFGETGRVLSQSRTSSNAWCRHRCENDPLVRNVMDRIAMVTRVPTDNYESFQILRYEEGQYYRTHHDMGPRQLTLPCGPRILTFFLYLSDVEEGGETGFPTLNLYVKPKKGSAILWPSTTLADNLKQDGRTVHEARPVIKGVKYAANSWIHSHNFAVPNLWGCTGAFDYI